MPTLFPIVDIDPQCLQIMDQIPDEWTNPSTRDIMMYEMASGGGVPYVSPSMLHTITKVTEPVQ